MTRYSVLLILAAALSGCLAPPLKPSADKLGAIRTILVIAVEPPPLEVTPDLMESGIPALYWQSETAPIDLFFERKLYRRPGGVLIAGLVSHHDKTPETIFPSTPVAPEKIPGLEPAASLAETFAPTLALAREAASQLSSGGFEAVSAGHYYRLPIPPRDRTGDLAEWHGAIRQWYNQDVSPIDYRSYGPERIDAVLEVGLGTYRIFETQMPLQVLVKLIDPATRRVIGRTGVEAVPVKGTAQTLLADEAEKFKESVTETGAQLVRRGLSDLGLPPAPRDARMGVNGIETALAAEIPAP